MKVFFDVDGVLIDGWHADPARRRPWTTTLAEDTGIDVERFETLMFGRPSGAARSVIQDCAVGLRDLVDALAQILPQAGYDGPARDFLAYWFEKDSVTNERVFDIVASLNAIPEVETYIATGQEHHRAAYLWRDLAFNRHFTAMFHSAELGLPKNDLRFFRAIDEALKIGPDERPIIVDDSRAIVALARQAGWDGILFETADDIPRHPRLAALLGRTAGS